MGIGTRRRMERERKKRGGTVTMVSDTPAIPPARSFKATGGLLLLSIALVDA